MKRFLEIAFYCLLLYAISLLAQMSVDLILALLSRIPV